MDISLPFVLLVAGLLTTFLPNVSHINRFAATVGTIAILLFAVNGFDSADPLILPLILSIPVLIGFLAGSFIPRFGMYVAFAANFLVFLDYGAALNYLGFELEFKGTVAILPVIGGVLPFISDVKGYFMNKWFGVDKELSGNLANIMVGAFGLFFATFQAQYLGVLLFGSGWVAVSVARERKLDVHPGAGFLALGYIMLMAKLYGLTDTSWMRGNFLMGVAAGTVAGFWNAMDFTGKAKWVLSTFVPVLVILLTVLLGIPNENFGAFPAYVGAAIGLAFYQYSVGKGKSELPLLLLVLGLSPIVVGLFPPKAPQSPAVKGTTVLQATTVVTPEPLTGSAIKMTPQFEGIWKSDPAASKITFKLGPEGGLTEGTFNDYKVELKIDKSGNPVSLVTNLAANGLTTFNDMRDKSVHGSDFLNVEKHPEMIYSSTAVKKEGDSYFVTGDFEMLGMKNPVNLEIRFTGNGMKSGKQYLTMIGRGQVDRTKHGMKGDSKIGDVVDVYFEIQLTKE